MKNLFVLALMAFCFSAFSQSNSLDSFYKKYQQQEKVTNINMEGWVLKLASDFVDEETENRILQKIEKVRVMVVEERNTVKSEDLQKLTKSIKKEDFETLMNVKDGKDKIDLYFRGTGDQVSDVLIMVNSPDEFILLSIEGNLNFSDLNDIQLDIQGAEHLKKVPEKNRA